MKELILIKLGGSVITDKSKPFTARTKIIRRLALSLKSKYLNKDTDLIISHGSGSFAHTPAAKYQTQKGLRLVEPTARRGLAYNKAIRGFCLTADAAIQINRIVIKEFLKLKIPVASFAPMSFIYGNKIILSHIQKALAIGILPVIYGDVIMNSKQGFKIYSGEKTLDIIASKLSSYYRKIKIIHYTDTNGVHDNKGATIPLITPKNFMEVKKYIIGSKNTDVTGGMIHKVSESLELAQKIDADIYITNGLSRGKFTKISKHVGVDRDNFKP
jgi:isopentenyl phosphate kinase